jgi:hypothetical protein
MSRKSENRTSAGSPMLSPSIINEYRMTMTMTIGTVQIISPEDKNELSLMAELHSE